MFLLLVCLFVCLCVCGCVCVFVCVKPSGRGSGKEHVWGAAAAVKLHFHDFFVSIRHLEKARAFA